MRLAFLALLLAGCAAGSNFKPLTLEGAQCKANCATAMGRCYGSSYTCDRMAATCMQSCQELDSLKAAGAK